MKNKKTKEIKDYDKNETVGFIDETNPLKLGDLGIELPKEPPTKVISLRLPKELLNKIQAFASQQDVSYTAVIKMLLSEGIDQKYIQKST